MPPISFLFLIYKLVLTYFRIIPSVMGDRLTFDFNSPRISSTDLDSTIVALELDRPRRSCKTRLHRRNYVPQASQTEAGTLFAHRP
ncbi:hypothetical protein HanRHA438_Chr15g0690891 [Helianthus annuus]|nr:hypothetical protein HanRHA438_Chr15g0690891 [Helianthus annuus]